MKKVKIVHTADLHFDTPFKHIGDKLSKSHKEELKEVFINIIQFCRRESVDILLIAGDIFDNFTLSRDTLNFMESLFNEIPNVKVFISPGNHDPYGAKSFYKLINWPKNVYIFKGDLEKVVIEDLNTTVWGAGFKEKYVKKSMLKNINSYSKYINIMVMHGEITNSIDGNEYNPIYIKEISESGMDYLALGHRHAFTGINKEGNTSYAYSGCPQGRGFDELGDKGILYGNVAKGIADLGFVKMSKRNYEEIEVNITDVFGYEEVRLKILEIISEEDRKNNLFKIILSGDISANFNIDENILKERLSRDFYFLKIIDNTNVKIDIDEISKGYSVKSIFAKSLLEKLENTIDEEEKEIIKIALKLGIRSLSEGQVKMDDY